MYVCIGTYISLTDLDYVCSIPGVGSARTESSASFCYLLFYSISPTLVKEHEGASKVVIDEGGVAAKTEDL